MWHRKRFFPGKGIFWLFILIFAFGGLGKSGFPGFLVPLFIFWFIGPYIFSAFKPPRKERFRREFAREPRPRQETAAQAAPPRPEPARAAPTRSLSNVPSSCRACGGPADETTVVWRGNRPVCGFCGTGF